MNNIDNLLKEYIAYLAEISAKVEKHANGDYSKLRLLILNFEKLGVTFSRLKDLEKQVYDATHSGAYYCSNCYTDYVQIINEFYRESQSEDWSIYDMIQHWKEDWTWKMEEGHVDESNILEKLDSLLSYYKFSPDDWIRRKNSIKSVQLNSAKHANSKFAEAYQECFDSFVFGNFRACLAMARSTVEAIVMDSLIKQNPNIAPDNITLAQITKEWNSFFKPEKNIRKKIDDIRLRANRSLHHVPDKIYPMPIENNAKFVLRTLLEVIDYFKTTYA